MFRGKVVFAHAGTLHHIDMLFYVLCIFTVREIRVYMCVRSQYACVHPEDGGHLTCVFTWLWSRNERTHPAVRICRLNCEELVVVEHPVCVFERDGVGCEACICMNDNFRHIWSFESAVQRINISQCEVRLILLLFCSYRCVFGEVFPPTYLSFVASMGQISHRLKES